MSGDELWLNPRKTSVDFEIDRQISSALRFAPCSRSSELTRQHNVQARFESFSDASFVQPIKGQEKHVLSGGRIVHTRGYGMTGIVLNRDELEPPVKSRWALQKSRGCGLQRQARTSRMCKCFLALGPVRGRLNECVCEHIDAQIEVCYEVRSTHGVCDRTAPLLRPRWAYNTPPRLLSRASLSPFTISRSRERWALYAISVHARAHP